MTVPLPPDFLRLPLAHRALHDVAAGRPENSRAAIRAAVAAGYGIEIDLQPSRDGQAMVFHDDDLGRLTAAQAPVAAQDAAALRNLALRGGDGEGIPTLPEVLALVAGRVPLLLELKGSGAGLSPGAGGHGGAADGAPERAGGQTGALARAVAAAVAGYAGPVAAMSFDPAAVLALRALAPRLPRGLTTCAFRGGDWPDLAPEARARLRAIVDYDDVGASFISHEAADLGRARVAELKARGAGVLCWTIRSPAEEAAARAVADNITFEGYLPRCPA